MPEILAGNYIWRIGGFLVTPPILNPPIIIYCANCVDSGVAIVPKLPNSYPPIANIFLFLAIRQSIIPANISGYTVIDGFIKAGCDSFITCLVRSLASQTIFCTHAYSWKLARLPYVMVLHSSSVMQPIILYEQKPGRLYNDVRGTRACHL